MMAPITLTVKATLFPVAYKALSPGSHCGWDSVSPPSAIHAPCTCYSGLLLFHGQAHSCLRDFTLAVPILPSPDVHTTNPSSPSSLHSNVTPLLRPPPTPLFKIAPPSTTLPNIRALLILLHLLNFLFFPRPLSSLHILSNSPVIRLDSPCINFSWERPGF